ncbi:MAG TPA: hypothetical protein VHF25_05020 [Nitriliruptorales bacterium]|nr:hypothetical protein [Nitriliruptorales bacterium]
MVRPSRWELTLRHDELVRAARLRRLVSDRPVAAFLFVAFAVAVGVPEAAVSRGALTGGDPVVGALGILGAVVPALAAVVVSGVAWGRDGVQELLSALFRGAGRLQWCVLALGAQALLSGLALLILIVATGAGDATVDWAALAVLVVVPLFAFQLWEELGFRGFLQRELQRRSVR